MEDSMMDDVLADDASDTQDQDWSQWMQWDWNDSTPEPGPKSNVNSSDSSPQLIAASDSTNGKSVHASDAFLCAPAVSNNNTFPNLRPLRVHPDSQLSASSAQLNNFEVDKVHRNAGQKRKSTSEDDGVFIEADYDSPVERKPHPSKKRSHNVVEKRYRANLNDKITELRDSIPSLRSLVRDTNGGKGTTNDDDASSFGAKLNKASILSKATEYIRHLEMRNSRLEEENTALKTRLRQLEKAAIVEQSASISIASASSPDSYSGTIDSIESPPSIFSHTEESSSSQKRLSSDHHPPEGLIKAPDYIKKMRASNPTQGVFAESYIKNDPTPSSEHNTQTRRGMTSSSKLFLGTIAGLMIMQNVSTDKSSDSDKKGLLAVPLRFVHSSLLSQLGSSQPSFLHWTQNPAPWGAWQLRAILSLMLTAGLAVGSAFLVFLYLFYARPKYDNDSPKGPSVTGARMTPAEIKRQAWLTSMQRLGVPQHRFFLEFFAVTSRWVEYTMCCIIGRSLYSSLTGITAEDEKGRIKTWDIAIDAQLAGGDSEVSKSRLVLTIFASGTLPRSPARIMLKAFHCRVLLWRVGRPGSLVSKVANNVGRILATYQWNMARELNRSLAKDHPDVLPSHLAALVDQECNDVLLDPIVQRAVNLTWSRPTQEGLEEYEALLDVVAEDPAIQTFADAIAGWWSSHLLQIALLQSFNRDTNGLSEKGLEKQLNLAVQVAPRLSAAHTRAAAMRAVIVENSRLHDIKTVLNALPTKTSCEQAQKQQQVSNFLDSSLPASVRNELAISARCAMIAAIIKARTTNDASFPSHLTIRKAITWLNQIPLDPLELTLISFAAVYHLLHAVVAYGDLLSSSSSSASSSSKSTPAPPPASIAGIDPSSSPLSSSPLSQRRLRSNSASEPSPQYNRIAKDLVYWARNAYNPAFYGLTSSMIDTVGAECDSICKAANLGLLASQDSDAVETSICKLIKTEARKQKHRRTKKGTPNAFCEESNEQVVESRE